MRIILTVSNFDFEGKLEKLPELALSNNENDYWILLPTLEKIEEKTGKLIDLGEPTSYSEHEIEIIQDVLNQAQAELSKEKNDEEDVLIERDDERLENLLDQIMAMVNLCIANKLSLYTKIA
ncbi:MAG: hypothetical protein ACPGLV_03955 [Bacteroidia bacterium]